MPEVGRLCNDSSQINISVRDGKAILCPSGLRERAQSNRKTIEEMHYLHSKVTIRKLVTIMSLVIYLSMIYNPNRIITSKLAQFSCFAMRRLITLWNIQILSLQNRILFG